MRKKLVIIFFLITVVYSLYLNADASNDIKNWSKINFSFYLSSISTQSILTFSYFASDMLTVNSEESNYNTAVSQFLFRFLLFDALVSVPILGCFLTSTIYIGKGIYDFTQLYYNYTNSISYQTLYLKDGIICLSSLLFLIPSAIIQIYSRGKINYFKKKINNITFKYKVRIDINKLAFCFNF